MSKHLWRRIKYLLLGVAGFLLVLLVWAVAEPYYLDKNEVVAEIPSLPQPWQGKQIAVKADFQAGMWMANTHTVKQAFTQIITDHLAITLIVGDFVYKLEENLTPKLDRVVELVRPLADAKTPTYAVLDNHDYGVKKLTQPDAAARQRADRIQQALTAIGIPVLQNEVIALSDTNPVSDNEKLYLVGIGAYLSQQSQPLEAIAQDPDNAARFVLMHNPASFAKLPAGTAPITVAGHTHGGQIRIPFLPE